MRDQGHAPASGGGAWRGGRRPPPHGPQQFAINDRRARVAALVRRDGLGRGQQARIARVLGVSATTVSRDVALLLALVAPCPYCGSYPLLAGPLADQAGADARRAAGDLSPAPLPDGVIR